MPGNVKTPAQCKGCLEMDDDENNWSGNNMK